ncbi:protein kinase domain-containing protein [Sorangium sp. So ce388]|uniref:protein kinase domain-containing protein n=1 Tax=Sorangium sp. So ce388 TaxID=3133309 RepID=UPI003F5BF17F
MSTVVCPQCANPCEQAHKFCPVCGFPISEFNRTSDDALIGTTLPGNYVILELVGVGGMGRVYRAEQKALGRTVAVKIIHPHLLGDESASVRFITEARAASRLNHPNSVGVIDFGKNGGQLYLVMEFLRGRDLARVVYEDGPLPFRRIADILCQVLAALAEAHHLGIIHRDLKPENIVLEPMRSGGDFVKVVDFGLAKMKAEVATTNITSPGIVCGTPDYMAPEQGRGDPIDARSDLYACGVILFQLLTGRLPFEAESPTQVVLMHLSLPPPDPALIAPEREIPEPLVEVTLRALEKDAARRYQSADEFAAALRASVGTFDTPSGRFSFAEATVICASCRAIVPRGQKFCGECGARIAQPHAPAPAPRAAPGAAPPTARRDRASSAPPLPLPFAAREEDLAWLDACLADVEGSVVAARIVGEQGVGKTRLLREFLDVAASRGDNVIQTGPDPWSAEVGYYALRWAIAGLAELPPDGGNASNWSGATPEARRGLLEIFGKGDRGSDMRRHAWNKPAAGGLSPDDRRFIAAEALRWALSRAQQAAFPHRVLLAVDDLHAVDGASRNAFADVIAEPPLAALLIVASHTPGFEPQWGGAVRALGGLPKDTALSLLRSSVSLDHRGARKTPPSTGGARLSPRRDGADGAADPAALGLPPSAATTSGPGGDGATVPPLYIDQLVRYTLEGGSDPPARMADLVAARIERLPQDARRTLQALAVIGDAADRPTLQRLLPDIRAFDDLLGKLVASGMIEEHASGIRTTHPLLRDVTLATIPAGVRRDLHAKATFDSAGDPLALPLEVQAIHAYHAQNAFVALMLLEQAADRSAARGDNAGSVLALRRGLDLARREIFRGELDDPVRAVLIFSRKLGDALARAGDLTDADGVLREALDLAGPGGPDRALVLGSLAYVAHQRERTSEASMYLREAIDLARQSADSDVVQSLDKMRREWMSR